MNLPEDTHLAYIVVRDAWYSKTPGPHVDEDPSVSVMASAEGSGGGVAWEFEVEERDLRGPSIRLKMFYDSFAAFTEMPEFFTGLQRMGAGSTLADVVALLDELGAVDETARVSPYAERENDR